MCLFSRLGLSNSLPHTLQGSIVFSLGRRPGPVLRGGNGGKGCPGGGKRSGGCRLVDVLEMLGKRKLREGLGSECPGKRDTFWFTWLVEGCNEDFINVDKLAACFAHSSLSWLDPGGWLRSRGDWPKRVTINWSRRFACTTHDGVCKHN